MVEIFKNICFEFITLQSAHLFEMFSFNCFHANYFKNAKVKGDNHVTLCLSFWVAEGGIVFSILILNITKSAKNKKQSRVLCARIPLIR